MQRLVDAIRDLRTIFIDNVTSQGSRGYPGSVSNRSCQGTLFRSNDSVLCREPNSLGCSASVIKELSRPPS